jgi:hypothetical protein
MGGRPTPELPDVAPPLLVEALVLPSPPMTTTPLGVPTTAFVSGCVYSSYVSALKRESGLWPPQPVEAGSTIANAAMLNCIPPVRRAP